MTYSTVRTRLLQLILALAVMAALLAANPAFADTCNATSGIGC